MVKINVLSAIVVIFLMIPTNIDQSDYTHWYRPVYPICIMEGPVLKYFLTEAGGEITAERKDQK